MEKLKAELEKRRILVPFYDLKFKEIKACADWLEKIANA
jgi:hypothetical protein